jgi:chromosome segregation ATPase
MNKFERLIEYILNEQEQKARELFHEIVVERSRNIYEDLMASEAIGGSPVDSMVDEIEADEQGQDPEMDMDMDDMDVDMDDVESDEAEDLDSDESEIEDRVMDLEDALDELKAEFDALMSQEEDEADEAEADEESEESEEADEESEEADDEVKAMETMHDDSDDSDAELAELREYIEKITPPKGEDHKAKSPVAGKNDMGGTVKNLVQGGEKTEGSKPKVGDMGAVDPRTAAKSAFGKKAPAAADADVKSTSPVGSK